MLTCMLNYTPKVKPLSRYTHICFRNFLFGMIVISNNHIAKFELARLHYSRKLCAQFMQQWTS